MGNLKILMRSMQILSPFEYVVFECELLHAEKMVPRSCKIRIYIDPYLKISAKRMTEYFMYILFQGNLCKHKISTGFLKILFPVLFLLFQTTIFLR